MNAEAIFPFSVHCSIYTGAEFLMFFSANSRGSWCKAGLNPGPLFLNIKRHHFISLCLVSKSFASMY